MTWSPIGQQKAHAEFFIAIKPVTTLVEVSRLIDPDMLIEIEASAVIQ
jgi:enamine deaminase RidA (YjgF/YER057c/UK114 family)